MKKFIFFLLVLSLIFSLSLSAKAAPASWQTFNNNTYNYQFNYPSANYYGANYTVSLDSGDLGNVVLNKIGGSKILPIYSVKAVANIETAKQLTDLMKSELALLPKTAIKTSNLVVAGIKATKMIDSKKNTIVGLIKDKTAYFLHSYLSSASKEPLYEKLLTSFKLIAPAPKLEAFDVKISSSTCAFNNVTAGWGGQVTYVRAITSGTAKGQVGARVELPLLVWPDDKWNCGDWTYSAGALITVGGTCTRKAGQPETTAWSVDTGGEEQGDFLKGKNRFYSAKIYKKGSIYSEKEVKASYVCQ